MLRHLLLILSFAIPASLGHAQSTISCTAESVKTPVVSAEGLAELVSDFVIHCRGGVPTPAGQPIPRITLQASLNSPVTSKQLGPAPQQADASPVDMPPPPPFRPELSEALLLIDEPAPNVQLPCPTLPCSIQGTGGVTSPYDGSAGHYNVFQAVQKFATVLEWSGVPFDPPGPTGTRTLRITNVRANVNVWTHVVCLSCLGIIAEMFVRSPDLAIDNPQQLLAFANQGLIFQSTTAVFSSTTPHNSTGPSTDFTLTFNEGFDNTFKPRTIAADPDDIGSNANQNVPGTSYPTASGFYNASFTGTYAGAGLATQGTRLVARFENVPPGVSLFVTEQPITASDTLHVQLVSTGPKGEGPYQPVRPTANGFAPIAANHGAAIAVWEVTSASATALEKAQFGVAVSFPADSASPFVQAGTTTVSGSLGPVTDATNASSTDPVPRFEEGAARPAFRIGVQLVPSVAAVVNAADFTPNSPVAPGSIAAVFGIMSFGRPLLSGPIVRINGIYVPTFGATSDQVNIQIPWELTGLSEATLVVEANGVQSDPLVIKLADPAPHIFLQGGHPLIARSLPISAGSTLTIYGTGFGPVANRPFTGVPARDFTSTTLNKPTLMIGGVPAEVTFSGLAPGYTGVWQINAVVPDIAVGPSGVLLQLSIGGVAANPVILE